MHLLPIGAKRLPIGAKRLLIGAMRLPIGAKRLPIGAKRLSYLAQDSEPGKNPGLNEEMMLKIIQKTLI